MEGSRGSYMFSWRTTGNLPMTKIEFGRYPQTQGRIEMLHDNSKTIYLRTCHGFTSSAVLIPYLGNKYPSFFSIAFSVHRTYGCDDGRACTIENM